MRKKYMRTGFFVAFMVLFLTVKAFCYQAEVTDISGRDYFSAVKEALAEAKESIKVVMYIMQLPLGKTNAKPEQLVSELIKARERG